VQAFWLGSLPDVTSLGTLWWVVLEGEVLAVEYQVLISVVRCWKTSLRSVHGYKDDVLTGHRKSRAKMKREIQLMFVWIGQVLVIGCVQLQVRYRSSWVCWQWFIDLGLINGKVGRVLRHGGMKSRYGLISRDTGILLWMIDGFFGSEEASATTTTILNTEEFLDVVLLFRGSLMVKLLFQWYIGIQGIGDWKAFCN